MPREHRASDVEVVRDQLGREPTTRFEVVVRCPVGHPLVIRDDPLDVGGEPFPTTFWLTCPDAVKAVSRLEADGAIRRLNERFADDADFRLAVNRELAQVFREGEIVGLYRKWFGQFGEPPELLKALYLIQSFEE